MTESAIRGRGPIGMSKDETRLIEGAGLHWPGSGEHLLAVYVCLKQAKRKGWIWAGVTIKAALMGPKSARASVVAELRERVEAEAKSTRGGPKLDRYEAAIKGLDALDQLAASP